MNVHTLFHRRWPALVALAGALALFFAFASASQAQQGQLTGTLDILHGDPPTQPGGSRNPLRPPIFRYFIRGDDGTRTELQIDEATLARAGGARALEGKRVTVTMPSGPAPAAAARRPVHSIRPAGGPGIATLDPAKPDITGKQSFAVILCAFADSTSHPPSAQYFTEMLAVNRPGLDHYWREVSYNKVNIANSAVFDWKGLPGARSTYHTEDEDGQELAKTDLLLADCTRAHDERVNFANFQGIAMVFDRGLEDGTQYGDRQEHTLDAVKREWAVAWLSARPDQNEVAHEMGHGFGLPHSSGPYTETYDSPWDVMSRGKDCSFLGIPSPDFPFGCNGTHTIAAHKDFLGWIPTFTNGAKRALTLPAGGRAIVTLARLAQPGTTGHLLARVPFPGSSTKFYSVELRQPVGYDEGVAATRPVVVIHMIDTTLDQRNAQVVDPDNNGSVSDDGAEWKAGETFTDMTNRITIRVDAIDEVAGTAVVTLENKPAITIGDVTVSEPSTAGSTAQARFTVRLSHASAQGIGLDFFTTAGTATKDVDYVHAEAHLSILAGATTATITVNVKADFVQELSETFFVNLKNPIGATIADSQAKGTILNRAASVPPPPPLPCPSPAENCQTP